MELTNKVIFVSGANRGIGKAIVQELLKHPVKKIYAAARKPSDLPKFGDERVVAITLDITDGAQIKKAVTEAGDIDLLINNAGILTQASVLTDDQELLMRDMQVNYFGTVNISRAFVPVLEKTKGTIANVVSVVGLASIAGIGGYSASKAALFSATQAMRGELKAKNIAVVGIFPGPIDTDMNKGASYELESVEVTAKNIVDGLVSGVEDIYPDKMSREIGQLWAKDPKSVERQLAGF